MNKTVHTFDPATGLYAGMIALDDSDLSPLEEGVYLLPGNAVEETPPSEEGKRARWVSNAWVLEDIPAPVVPVIPELPPQITYAQVEIDPAAFLTMPLPKKTTPTDLQGQLVAAVQTYMDTMAQAYKYDSIASAISYAEEPSVPQFQREGKLFRAWRSQVWKRCYELLDEVQTGTRSVPDEQQLIALLPLFDSQEQQG